MYHGDKYLRENASWLGYDVSRIHNPNGENRPPLTRKERNLERLNKYVEKAGLERDLITVSDYATDETYEESLESLQNDYILLREHFYAKHIPTQTEGFVYATYGELLSDLDRIIEIVTSRNVDAWQNIEDIIHKHLASNERVYGYSPLSVWIIPDEEKDRSTPDTEIQETSKETKEEEPDYV
jgi:hypothetical protein